MPENLVEGQTAPIDHQLLRDGASFNASGATVTLHLCDRNGTELTLSGTVAWTDDTVSKVRYTPDANDLVAADTPHRARWKVTLAGEISFYPDGDPDRWDVRGC